MVKGLVDTLRRFKAWQIVLAAMLVSQAITAAITVLSGLFWWEGALKGLIWTGVVASLVNCILIIPPIVFMLVQLVKLYDQKTEADAFLEERTLFLQTLIEAIPNPVFFKDTAGVYLGCNQAFLDLIGCPAEKIIGKTVYDVSPKALADKYHEMDEALLKIPGVQVYEAAVTDTSGQRHAVLFHKATFDKADGSLGGIIGIILDITERKTVEEELRSTKNRLEHLLRYTPAVIYSCSLGEEVVPTFVSENIKDVFGFNADDLIGNASFWKEGIHPEDAPRVLEEYKNIFEAGRYSHVYRFKVADGEYRWVYDELKLVYGEDGEPKEIFGYWVDITDRVSAEEALRESEERFRRVFEEGPLGMARFSKEGHVIDANAVFCDMFGYSAEELKKKTFLDLTAPERRDLDRENVTRMIAGEVPSIKAEKRYIRQDGSDFWGAVTATVVRDEQGQYLYTLAMLEDITERRQAEESLRLLDKAVQTSTVGFTFRDLNNTIKYMNPAEERMHGYRSGELIGRDISSLAPPDLVKPLTREQMRELKGWARESLNKKKDGSLFPVHLVSDMVKDDNGEPLGIITACEDITERKRSEEQILVALKEKEVLLSEVHHRVKNNLAIVISLLQLQSRQVEDENARRILKESQTRIRSLALVHEKLYQIGDFARLDVRGYLRALLQAILRSYRMERQSIDLVMDIDDITLNIDKLIPLGLIVNELATNSLKYAFGDKTLGELRISLKRTRPDEIALQVSDKGPGLPEGLDIHEAHSLGLRLVATLANQLGGTLSCRNDNGACFSLTFNLGE